MHENVYTFDDYVDALKTLIKEDLTFEINCAFVHLIVFKTYTKQIGKVTSLTWKTDTSIFCDF